MSKENIRNIAESIRRHVKMENERLLSNKAFARANCSIATNGRMLIDGRIVWLTNDESTNSYNRHTLTGVQRIVAPANTLESDGMPVYKNTRIGEMLTKYYCGQHKYSQLNEIRRKIDYTLSIHNRASYSNFGTYDPVDVEIRIDGDENVYRFQRLSDLFKDLDRHSAEIRKHEEELEQLKKDKERIAKELAEQKEREERERLEAERQRKEEESRKKKLEIERLEQMSRDAENEIAVIQSFMRRNVELRSQHLLDPYQEDAKRSHLFDGVPIVIDGGPGTGKTTTMIQRLKFLISPVALAEYEDEAKITPRQREYLTDPSTVDSHWLFFSPTDLLLRYLQVNMQEEGLKANERNTRTVPKFRNKIMRDYQLFNPAKDGPFKDFKPHSGQSQLIMNPDAAIRDFKKYIVKYCVDLLNARINLKSSGYEWRIDAEKIKRTCADGVKANSINDLIRLFNELHNLESECVTKWKVELKDLCNDLAVKIKIAVVKDEASAEQLRKLFDRWRRERMRLEDNEEDVMVEDEEEEMNAFARQEFESQIFSQAKQLLRQLGLKKIDSKIKLSRRNQEFNDIVGQYITDEVGVEKVGKLAWFVRNFASLCNGPESNVLGIIPKLYKAFRKTQLEGEIYKADLLKDIIDKDSNKHLHPDEQNLLIGFINETLNNIYRYFPTLFNSLKHNYAVAYKESVRPVIGIDEATDYSILDYYFMISFRHYEFSSITLCGDIMQGLNGNGIHSWDDLRGLLPKLEVKTLNVSYRQLPTLLDLARELYRDDQGEYPSYESDKKRSDHEPKPLMLISDDEEEKAVWISQRILDIYQTYNELPSVAIFVGDNVDIPEFIDRITDLDLLNGIDIVDCSGDRQLQNKEQVRVFRLSEVKGMEFEAAFFYDIDDAVSGHDESMMRRYIYVGISRATSHLAATMKHDSGYGITSYFETEDLTW